MGGKSTYIRLIALIQLMGHIGSFVPCNKARLPILSGIYSRVGSSYICRFFFTGRFDENIILLYKVLEGIGDPSFGIHVAEMVNFP